MHNKHTQRFTQSTRNVKIRKLIYDIRLTRLSVSFRSATYTESIVVVVALVDVARQRTIIVIFWTAICAMRTSNTELSAYQSTTRNRQATLNFSRTLSYNTWTIAQIFYIGCWLQRRYIAYTVALVICGIDRWFCLSNIHFAVLKDIYTLKS